jgi:hypothetical protein
MTLVWLTFVLLVAALCIARPDAGRLFIGLFFLAMALGVNLTLVFSYPQGFVVLGQDSYIPLYRLLFTHVVALAPAFLGLLAVAYELTVGLLLLGKQRAVKLGLLMGSIFLVGTAPFMLWSLPDPGLAVVLAWLYSKDFDTTLLEMVRSRWQPHQVHT